MSEESQETNSKKRAPKRHAKEDGSVKHSEPKHKGASKRLLRGILGFSWPIIAFFGASFVVGIIAVLISLATDQPIGELIETNHWVRLVYQLFVVVAVLIFVVLPLFKVFFKKGTPWQEVFGLTKKASMTDVGLAFVMFGGYLAATIAASALISVFIPGIDLEQAQDLGVSAPQATLQYIAIFLTLVVIPPLFEELIFRGFVFSALRKQYSFWISAVLTSLAFAIIHLQLNVGIDVFILSLFLCYLRERTGSLWAPIFLHTIKNVLAFLLLFVFNVR